MKYFVQSLSARQASPKHYDLLPDIATGSSWRYGMGPPPHDSRTTGGRCATCASGGFRRCCRPAFGVRRMLVTGFRPASLLTGAVGHALGDVHECPAAGDLVFRVRAEAA